jgi:chromosome segregation ATPase
MDIATILDVVMKFSLVLGGVTLTATQFRAYIDGSAARNTIKQTDDIISSRIKIQEEAIERINNELLRSQESEKRLRADLEKSETRISTLRTDFDTETGRLNALVIQLEQNRDSLITQNQLLAERVAVGETSRIQLVEQINQLQFSYDELQKQYKLLVARIQAKDEEIIQMNTRFDEFLRFIGLESSHINEIKKGKFEVYYEWKSNSNATKPTPKEPEIHGRPDRNVSDSTSQSEPGIKA